LENQLDPANSSSSSSMTGKILALNGQGIEVLVVHHDSPGAVLFANKDDWQREGTATCPDHPTG
jgi:hypothetical protein